jgi:hypothetical protein
MLKVAVQKEKELEISTSEKHPWESCSEEFEIAKKLK